MARTRKWVIYAAIAGVLAAGYAIYAVFFLERVPIGALCKASGDCQGQCIGFGDLLPDYSHQEVCTRECSAASDCPATTSCR
ncbi:MAG TPA: hypothetical protein VKB80_04415, partial [Kofleriaceae bacterium]|nr:hypothetical protein [Kofleriaceae bacterium]